MKSNIFNFWTQYNLNKNNKIKNVLLNFGPQHPAAHGVLRLILQLNGELVEKADPHIGFLHRGTEKLIESKLYLQALPYFDRLDYVSMMSQEHAFCICIEKSLNSINYTAFYIKIRLIFDELTRLLNHFLTISTHSLDVGNMSPLFWSFEEREKIMEFYERVSGARMHAAFYRPNDINITGININLFYDVSIFVRDCFKSLTEIYSVLCNNKMWKLRLVNIGVLTYINAIKSGATGVIARASGVKKDLRLLNNTTYSNYWYLNFNSFTGKSGDSYDRFIIRMREMFESLYLITQVISTLNLNTYNYNFNKWKSISQNKFTQMEKLINHFKYYSEGYVLNKGLYYGEVESPKGEFGVTIVSNNTNKSYRCKIKSPAYTHLQILSFLSKGHYFADIVTLIGSQDIVFGEVDR